MLDYFALFVLIVLVATVLVLAWWLGALPGRIARRRDHPQADAIVACGWLGLLTLGPGWIVAMVWAFVRPRETVTRDSDEQVTALIARVEALESRLDGELSR